MGSTNYHINRMIQDLNGNIAARQAFQADPQPFFETYRVSEQERDLLSDGSIDAMTRLGIHPNLQMKWLSINAQAKPSGPGPLAAFLDRLLGE